MSQGHDLGGIWKPHVPRRRVYLPTSIKYFNYHFWNLKSICFPQKFAFYISPSHSRQCWEKLNSVSNLLKLKWEWSVFRHLVVTLDIQIFRIRFQGKLTWNFFSISGTKPDTPRPEMQSSVQSLLSRIEALENEMSTMKSKMVRYKLIVRAFFPTFVLKAWSNLSRETIFKMLSLGFHYG